MNNESQFQGRPFLLEHVNRELMLKLYASDTGSFSSGMKIALEIPGLYRKMFRDLLTIAGQYTSSLTTPRGVVYRLKIELLGEDSLIVTIL